jgi:hypothetical protein
VTNRLISDPAGALAIGEWTTVLGPAPEAEIRYFVGRRRFLSGDESGGPHEGQVCIRGLQTERGSTERWITVEVRHTAGGPDVRIDGVEPGQARELGRALIQSADEAERDQATDDAR